VKQVITQQELKQVISYDKDAGSFVRLDGRTSYGKVGRIDTCGYTSIMINRRSYMAHRLAWLYEYGTWPANQIDHINRQPSDNRIANLREATHAQNMQNKAMPRNNKSGFHGVCWSTRDSKWRTQIRINKKTIALGLYDCPIEASNAYQVAKAQYHPFRIQ